jgi:hypothetical protein
MLTRVTKSGGLAPPAPPPVDLPVDTYRACSEMKFEEGAVRRGLLLPFAFSSIKLLFPQTLLEIRGAKRRCRIRNGRYKLIA